ARRLPAVHYGEEVIADGVNPVEPPFGRLFTVSFRGSDDSAPHVETDVREVIFRAAIPYALERRDAGQFTGVEALRLRESYLASDVAAGGLRDRGAEEIAPAGDRHGDDRQGQPRISTKSESEVGDARGWADGTVRTPPCTSPGLPFGHMPRRCE